MSTINELRRLETADIEIGVSEALKRHATRHVAQHKPVSNRVLAFERRRPRWLRECVGEATGVFLYVLVSSNQHAFTCIAFRCLCLFSLHIKHRRRSLVRHRMTKTMLS